MLKLFAKTIRCAIGTTGGKGKIMNKKLEKYIKSIRNNEKKRYAVDYIADVICHDNQTENRNYDLGAMAKQAVRMNINELINNTI